VKKSVANNQKYITMNPSDESESGIAPPPKKVKKPSNAAEKEKETKSKKAYTPQLNSTPYAILVALYVECGDDPANWRETGLSAEDLIKKGQPFTTTDMMTKVRPAAFGTGGKSGASYNGVSCLKTLVEKGMVKKKGRKPVLVYLTDRGLPVARQGAMTEGQDLWPLPTDLVEGVAGSADEDERPKKKAKTTTAAEKGKGKKKAVTEDDDSEEERPAKKQKTQPRASTSRLPAAAEEEESGDERESYL